MDLKNLFRKKSSELIIKETEAKEHKLKKALSVYDLIALGIGAIIGSGIYVVTGIAAVKAGPAVILSFI